MYIKTAHGTFLAIDRESRLVHERVESEDASCLVMMEDVGKDGDIQSGPLCGYTAIHAAHGVSFVKDGHFLCAEPNNRRLAVDRKEPEEWETFQLQPIAIEEVVRFRKVVNELIEEQKPVKIHCGCGPTPRNGFLNLDIFRHRFDNSTIPPDEYFIFPFADQAWNIPDNCVDYIYHEDFIEHISQLQQIQFLAESFRVLKAESYHRVNTPDLIASMKRHSNFEKGFKGVYTGELQWGHIALFSKMSLKEMAELVGYRDVVFTTKSHGVSKYAVPDTRPWDDRDEILGNIYVDLRK
ncbi:hypothetical protein ACFL33_02020 [Pseudomonadota bacterium]